MPDAENPLDAPPSDRANAGGVVDAQPRVARLLILCDGTNFLLSSREAGIHYTIDVPMLARRLAKCPPGYILTKLRYYTAPLSAHSDAARRQQRFFEEMRRAGNVELVLGRHEPRSGGSYHVEKETDVRLAVDMLVGAYKNTYDVAMLITGDTDFVPVVEAVREAEKKVIWVHFPGQAHSDALRQVCNSQLELSDKILRTCRKQTWAR
jgi:uncharacterized LabA/DUF88 family protein